MGKLSSFILCSGLVSGLAAAKQITVKPGQSIQSAIDGASPGDQITVAKGVYSEQLTINKSIQLIGQTGATIIPPATFTQNSCTYLAGNKTTVGADTQAGICVTGTNVKFGDFNGEHRPVSKVGTYVQNVEVKGFEVHGFTGLNIAVVGAKNTLICDNTVRDGTQYGILTVGSQKTVITRNKVDTQALNFIAICMDDKSDVTVTQNEVSAYKVGLCVQTNKAVVTDNTANGCCVGAYIDPGVDAAQVTYNHIVGSTNPDCLTQFLAAGIVLDGASNAEVRHNDISGVTNNNVTVPYSPPAVWFANFGGKDNLANTVDYNTMTNNNYNVLISSNSGNNEIKHNVCKNPTAHCNP